MEWYYEVRVSPSISLRKSFESLFYKVERENKEESFLDSLIVKILQQLYKERILDAIELL